MADFKKTIEIKIDSDLAVKSLNEIENSLSDINKEISKVDGDNLNTISKNFEQVASASKEYSDSLVEAGVRITQAFVTTTGTIASFATTEENATQITAKLAQTMAIADSIEQVYNATKAIGELRTKGLALAEATKTTATAAGTVATGAATTATTALGVAIKFMLGPIGLVIAAIGVATALYYSFSKSAKQLAEEQNKLNDSILEFAELTTEADAAISEKRRLNIEDQIKREQQAFKDRAKANKDNATLFVNLEERLQQQLNDLRSQGAAEDSEEVQNKLKALDKIRVKQLQNSVEQKKIAEESKFFEIDIARDAANRARDLEIEKLATSNEFADKRTIVDLEYAKALEEINARKKKGDSTAADDELTLIQQTANKKKAIRIEEANFELSLRNEIVDTQLQNLSLIDTQSARFQEIELNRQKALDAFNTAVANGEIKSAEELARINNDADTKVLALRKQIAIETKAIAKETADINLTAKTEELNKVTSNITEDLKNQSEAVRLIAESDIKKIEDLKTEALDKIKDLNSEDGKAQVKAIEENAAAKIAAVKKGEAENLKVVKENIQARTFAEREAILEIEALNLNTASRLKDNTKVITSLRIESANKLLDLEKKRLALAEEIEIANAKTAKKSETEIEAISKKYKVALANAEENNKQFVESLNREDLVKALDEVASSLTALSEINIFSDADGINNFLRSINGINKALAITVNVFKDLGDKIKKAPEGIESPEKLKERLNQNAKIYAQVILQAVSAVVDIANEIAQAAFQANIDKFQEQVDVLEEKKKELDDQLKESADRIEDLQDNAAKAQIADRTRIIGLIDKERKREQELAKQKVAAAKQQLELEEKIKEEKKKQFIADKIGAIAQATISTALGILAVWANPATVAAAPVLSGVIAGLGAIQIGVIASQPVPEFKIGGFTETANDNNKPVGIVHANERVAPAWMTSSPKYKHTIAELESSRQKGFASGGYASPTDTSSEINAILAQQTDLIAQIANRPTVVNVQEIQTASANVNRVKVKATL